MKKTFFFIAPLLIASPLFSASSKASASVEPVNPSNLYTKLLIERFLESNPLQKGAVNAEKIAESFESLLAQQPQPEQSIESLAKSSALALDAQLNEYPPADLIAAGQYLFLQGKSLGLVEILKYKLADIFIKDHSPEMIEVLKSIKSLGNQANLSLQVLQQSGAVALFMQGKDNSFLDSSLINYEQLAYILDVYADIQLGKLVKLDHDLGQSFPSKVWEALKTFVGNHNKQILAGLGMAGSIALTALTHGAAAPSIAVAAASIAKAAMNASDEGAENGKSEADCCRLS